MHVDPNGAWVKNVDGMWRTLQSKEPLPKKSYFRVQVQFNSGSLLKYIGIALQLSVSGLEKGNWSNH